METTRHLLKFFFMVAMAFFLFALVWWFVGAVKPTTVTVANTGTSTQKHVNTDWLPPPRKYGGLLGHASGTNNGNAPKEYVGTEYVSNEPYNGWGTSNNNGYTYSKVGYVNYTTPDGGPSSGNINTKNEVIKASDPATQTVTPLEKGLYIRNLSIYQGGHVYTGLLFTGEAKAMMFRDGKFPIVVVDPKGMVVGVSAAIATTNWAVPGWVRFQTRVDYTLPNNLPCTMVFEGALTQVERQTIKPTRVPVPVRCN